MPDYSDLLRRALAGAPGGSERHEVYAKARTALVQRLRDARTAPRDITRERLLLEQSVRKIEAEAADRLRLGS